MLTWTQGLVHCQVQRNPGQASLSTYLWLLPALLDQPWVAKDESTLNLSNPGACFSFLYKPAIQPVNSLGSALLSVLSFSFSRLTLLLPHLRVPVQSGLCQMLLTVFSLTSAIKTFSSKITWDSHIHMFIRKPPNIMRHERRERSLSVMSVCALHPSGLVFQMIHPCCVCHSLLTFML